LLRTEESGVEVALDADEAKQVPGKSCLIRVGLRS
jgi:hypothetical protein